MGTFVVDVKHDEAAVDQTFLLGSGNSQVQVMAARPAVVTVASAGIRSPR